MRMTPHRPPRWAARRLLCGGLLLSGAAALAACSSSSPGTAAGPATSAASSSPASAPAASPSAAGITISATSVPGVGTVLVNGQGMTLYLLTSEKGGKITCTDENGCTKLWPDTELPKGVTAATAGSGINASLLGTVKEGGSLYVTYHGWPLYTFSGDAGPRVAHGQGITSFGGTWYVLDSAGNPVTSGKAQTGY